MTSSQKFSLKLIWLPALILCITYISFYPSLQCGFVNWDDPTMVSANHLVASNTIQLKDIFTSPVAYLYHPLTTLSLALNYQAGKLDPSGYHSLNVYLHLLNTLFVFIFIYLLSGRKLLVAAIVSLLFGIHPMHVESVAWVTERKDVLFMFFLLPGLITYLYYRQTHKAFWYALTLLLFLLSILSKPHAVVFPFILLLLDYFLKEKWQARLFTEKIPFFVISIAFGLLTYFIMQGGGTMNTLVITFSPWQRFCFTCYSVMMYLVKLFFPFNLSAHYPYPRLDAKGELPFLFYLYPFVLLGLTTLVCFFMRKKTVVVFGLLFYLVSLGPVLQIVSNNTAIIADRYSYLSYIGLFFIPAWWLGILWENRPVKFQYLKIPATSVLTLFLAMCCFLTFQQCKVWHDSITLWNNAINCDSKNIRAYNNRGNAYRFMGKPDLAIADYTTAINLNPMYAEAYANRGLAYWDQRKPEPAIANYTAAITIYPKFDLPYYNRGVIYSNLGKNELAIADFNAALGLNPKYAHAYYSRGLTYWNEQKPELAISDFNTAISLDPQFDLAFYNRGIAYANQGKNELAIADFNKVISLNPKRDLAYYNRGVGYATLGKNELAIADFDTAISLNPNYVQAYNNRGLSYWNQGKPELAMADYNKAISLYPLFDLAYYNRGVVYASQGKSRQAVDDFNMAIKLNPKYAHAYYSRGLAYWNEGKLEQAIANYTVAIELDPRDPQAFDNRAIAYLSLGKLKLAIADYDSAIALNPKFDLAYFNRGNAYGSEGKPELAIADYNVAIRLNPRYPEAYLNRGTVYATEGKLDLAIADYNAAIKLNPQYAQAYNNRGIVEEQKGEIAQAKKDIEKAKLIDSPTR
jgi:protein O-mannosyl-transferase